jgi:hypothetical protein
MDPTQFPIETRDGDIQSLNNKIDLLMSFFQQLPLNKRVETPEAIVREPTGLNTDAFPRYLGKESSGEDSSSDSSDDSRNDKRDSLLGRVLHTRRNSEIPKLYKEQESYDQIRLNALTVPAAFKFYQDIDRYESKFGIPIPGATQVSDRVRDQLLVEHTHITVRKFYLLKNYKLFKLIQSAVKPKSSMAFSKLLQSSIRFPQLPEGYDPAITNFRPLYEAILIFKRSFLDCLAFLSWKNNANIPRCDHRDGGLIKIFIDSIPFSFGKSVFGSLHTNKFTDLDEFITAFINKVKSIKNAYDETRIHGEYFRSSYSVPTSPQHHRSPPPPPRSLPRRYPSDARTNAPRDHPALAHITEDEAFDELGPSPWDTPPSDDADVLQISSKPLITGCFRKLAGECTKPNCQFRHDAVAMHQLYLKQRDMLERSPYKNPTTSVAAVDTFSDDDLPVDDLTHTVNAVFCQLGIERHSNVVHSGRISCANTFLDTAFCLFDTGAISHSFIDQRWIDKHRATLMSANALSPTSIRTKLADATTTQVISEQCVLQVEFSLQQRCYSASVNFLIMPTLTTSVIIGLPHILGSFLDFFVESLSQPAALNASTSGDFSSEFINPWSHTDGFADAEEEPDLPVIFGDALHYLEVSPSEALEEFFKLFDSHVSVEMAANTDVLRLLRDKGTKVFVPQNWEGINGITPIEFNWSTSMPDRLLPRIRPVNPKIFLNAKEEFARLKQYLFSPSSSPIASNLVIAPKGSPPYIRLCGDYVQVNKFIISGASIIPHVQKELDKIRGFRVYIDLDLVNSFHQFPLGPITSSFLSLVTPWGQVQPKFLPEGVTPASGLLQEHMVRIFEDFAEWSIVIFDNLLLLAHDYADAYRKLELILDRCIARNLFLKFSKSYIGFTEVKFFGYCCKHQSYGLSQDRKDGIMQIPMPTTQKAMQSFLGAALFFRSFVPHFSDATCVLHDMVRKDFDWNPSTWKKDYTKAFDNCKAVMASAVEISYPDFSLPWVLQVDASDRGVGSVLLQQRMTPAGLKTLEPIAFHSKKFSDVASRWHTYDKEAFAIYHGIKSNEYYLRAKDFVVQTDHRNLVYIEKSTSPRVIRWFLFLQSFRFVIQHIAGKVNTIADWGSRLHYMDDEDLLNNVATTSEDLSIFDIIKMCHVGRSGHMGVKRTYALIQSKFPGLNIAVRMIEDFIYECSVCQKVRNTMMVTLPASVRSLQQPNHRAMVGIDTLYLPPDSSGYTCLYVIRNLFTKFVYLTPSKTHTAISMASCLFSFFANFGKYDYLISDPGSDLTSNAVKHLNSWLGIHHRLSLVGRHQSNGVEAANRQIIRYMRSIFMDERISNRWSDASIIGWVQFLMNTYDDTETSISPFVATFGSNDLPYSSTPMSLSDPTSAGKFVQALNNDLKLIRDIIKHHQSKLRNSRESNNSSSASLYQPGDYVMVYNTIEFPAASKLHPPALGPYKVVKHVKNDVTVADLITGSHKVHHMDDLRLFVGSPSDAFHAASKDTDQFIIDKILAHRGEPRKRTTMSFEILYTDGTSHWLPFSADISTTLQFEIYCKAKPALRPLLYSVHELNQLDKAINASPITHISIGDIRYVDLRSYGSEWYQSLCLPDSDYLTYVLPYQVTRFNKLMTSLWVKCHVLGEEWHLNHVFMIEYGSYSELDKSFMILIDEDVVKQYPKILGR